MTHLMVATPLTSHQIIQSTLVAAKVKDVLENIFFPVSTTRHLRNATAGESPSPSQNIRTWNIIPSR